jgi:hypothetical protein
VAFYQTALTSDQIGRGDRAGRSAAQRQYRRKVGRPALTVTTLEPGTILTAATFVRSPSRNPPNVTASRTASGSGSRRIPGAIRIPRTPPAKANPFGDRDQYRGRPPKRFRPSSIRSRRPRARSGTHRRGSRSHRRLGEALTRSDR